MQNTNSPKRSVRLNNKRLARLDIKKDANTDTPSVHADLSLTNNYCLNFKLFLNATAFFLKIYSKIYTQNPQKL